MVACSLSFKASDLAWYVLSIYCAKIISLIETISYINSLETSPKYTQAGVYGKCVLHQSQIVFIGLRLKNL